MGFFKKLSEGLKKTRDNIVQGAANAFGFSGPIDEELYEELEETLIMSDVGVNTSLEIIEKLKLRVKEEKIKDASLLKDLIKDIMIEMLDGEKELDITNKPAIILVIGVNGVGKTTTIGKMSYDLKSKGYKVILGAADTFRAAAIEQLEIWANRAEVDIIKHQEGSDPSAVVFDTLSAGKNRNADIIICDTAGRLHNKKNLMAELDKMNRTIERELPDSSKEVLLVLDATTGQNALNQAREFKAVTNITGLVLTKLDGSARGGVVLAIKNELEIPIKYIGVGEQIDDLQPFDAKEFVYALFGDEYTEDEDETENAD